MVSKGKNLSTVFVNIEDANMAREYMTKYNLDGFSTNIKMMAKHGKDCDYKQILRDYRKAADSKEVFTQVGARDVEGMLKDAEMIRNYCGSETIVKFPATDVGLQALRIHSDKGYRSCATLVFSAVQAIFALRNGAESVAFFWDYMQKAGIDAFSEISAAAEYKRIAGCDGSIGAAALRTAPDIALAFRAGITSLTLNPDTIDSLIPVPASKEMYENFMGGWDSVHGFGTSVTDVCNLKP